MTLDTKFDVLRPTARELLASEYVPSQPKVIRTHANWCVRCGKFEVFCLCKHGLISSEQAAIFRREEEA